MKHVLDIEQLLSGNYYKFSDLVGKADGIMITGSYATKSALNYSDIDIIVLSQRVNYLYSESIYYRKKNIHIIFFPYYKFQEIIIHDINMGKGIYASMIRKGLVFKDTESKLLTKTKQFILSTIDGIRSEQVDFDLIHKITSGVDILKNSSSIIEKIYCASELLIDISRFVSCAYIAGAKHLSRITTTQFPNLAIIDSYQQFITTKDPSNYIRDIGEILMKYGGRQYTWTSSWVFTYPFDHHIMIFFPMLTGNEMHLLKYITGCSTIAQDCHIHGFYIGKNQNMEEGYYLFIYTNKTSVEKIYRELENYKKVILSDPDCNLQISFPYKSLFYKGLQFGGATLFIDLLPYFAQVWWLYFQLRTKFANGSHYARIIATYYFYQLYEHIDFIDPDISNLLKDMYDILTLEAVDPNGLYNAVQMDYMKEQTLYKFQYSYMRHSATYKEIISSFRDDSQAELQDFNLIFQDIFKVLRNTPDNDILYPDIYTINNKKVILTINISLHIMSILQLSPQEQFGIIYNLLQYKNNDIQ